MDEPQYFEDAYKDIYESHTYQMSMYEARKLRFFVEYVIYSGFLAIPEGLKEEFNARWETINNDDGPFGKLACAVSLFDNSVPSMVYEEEKLATETSP